MTRRRCSNVQLWFSWDTRLVKCTQLEVKWTYLRLGASDMKSLILIPRSMNPDEYWTQFFLWLSQTVNITLDHQSFFLINICSYFSSFLFVLHTYLFIIKINHDSVSYSFKASCRWQEQHTSPRFKVIFLFYWIVQLEVFLFQKTRSAISLLSINYRISGRNSAQRKKHDT
jgi:hypothetical protein